MVEKKGHYSIMEAAACQNFSHLNRDVAELKKALRHLGYDVNYVADRGSYRGRDHLDTVYAYMVQQARCRRDTTVARLKSVVYSALQTILIAAIVLRIGIHVYEIMSKGKKAKGDEKFQRVELITERVVHTVDGTILLFVGVCLWYKFDVTRHFMSSMGLIKAEHVIPISRVSFTDLVFISLAGFILVRDGANILRKTFQLE